MVSLDWSGVLKQGTKSRQAQLTAGCELVKRTDHSLPLHTRRQHENRIQILLKTFTNFHILPTNLLTSRTCECAGDCVEYCMFIGLNNGILRFSHVLQSHYHSFQISLRSYLICNTYRQPLFQNPPLRFSLVASLAADFARKEANMLSAVVRMTKPNVPANYFGKWGLSIPS